MNKHALLRASRLHKTYQLGRTQVPVLHGVDLAVDRGDFLVITGESGSGKSTLLHLLGALDVPTTGSVYFDGLALFGESKSVSLTHYRNHDVGFIFQFYHLLPELNVLENVMVARFVGRPVWRWMAVKREARLDGEQMLERVGLMHRVRHRPAELSGGERQRVAIARALMNKPSLLLADEPTGNLDTSTGSAILSLLTELNTAGQTLVMVTHDPKVASRAHRRAALKDGVMIES